jgi:hypothetical protein
MKPLVGNQVIWVAAALAVAALAAPSAFARHQDSSETNATVDQASATLRFNATWERNADQSDDPREKMREAMGGRGGPGGMPGRGGMPGGGPGEMPGGMSGRGGGGRPGGMGGRRGGPPSMEDMLGAASSIETTLANGEFKVIDPERARIYYLDGEKHVRETPGGDKLETVAKMKGDQIVIEEKTERGMKSTQTFALGPDGNVLVVTRRLEGNRFKEPVVIRSIYDLQHDSETP